MHVSVWRGLSRLGAGALALSLVPACGAGDGGEDGKRPDAGAGTGKSSAAASAPSPSPSDDLLSGKVRIAVKYNQPGFNVQKGVPYYGFENELVEFLEKELKLDAIPVRIDSESREGYLTGEDRTADLVVATYSITSRREKKVDFAGPYLKTHQGLMVRKGYTGIKSVKDTAGKRICTVTGSTSDPGAEDEGPLADAIVETRATYQECINQLKQGDFEAVHTDKAVLYGFVEEDKEEALEVLERSDESFNVGDLQLYGVGLPEGHPAACARVAEALKKFNEEEWLTKFSLHFPKLRAQGNAEDTYKPPSGAVVDEYSCDKD
ncbi:transporter substrate-binding domain-containing protein [Streptomyces daliensis]|uniref:Transporter substrate-binding domain-containing protein n=1 Tax=Streptomyces daliensis TaxID=299421 RepID=A0A8T4J195_9ACTN|nr:transporter substrate-binding domain-containing protein [Streptomyces daliensis]